MSSSLIQPHSQKHLLDHMLASSASTVIHFNQDVYSDKGIKIIGNNQKFDHDTYEKLLNFKINKPLEDLISFEDGITPEKLEEGLNNLFYDSHLAGVIKEREFPASLIYLLKNIQLPPALKNLLTLFQSEHKNCYNHALEATILGSYFAYKKKLSGNMMADLVQASLFQNMGYLYLPASAAKKGICDITSFDEYKQYISHPVISKAILKQANVNERILTAVEEHHEKPNGTGFPGFKHNNINFMGQLLAGIDECLSYETHTRYIHSRVQLKILENEVDKNIVYFFEMLNKENPVDQFELELELTKKWIEPHLIFATIGQYHYKISTLKQECTPSSAMHNYLTLMEQRLIAIDKVFNSSGVNALLSSYSGSTTNLLDDVDVKYEVYCIFSKIQIKMAELEQEVRLRVSNSTSLTTMEKEIILSIFGEAF